MDDPTPHPDWPPTTERSTLPAEGRPGTPGASLAEDFGSLDRDPAATPQDPAATDPEQAATLRAPISPPKPKGPQEVEWQLEGADLVAVEVWLRAHPPSPGLGELGAATGMTLVDTYYDTADWRLFRAGYVLRIRARGLRLEATIKSISAAKNGLRKRLEIEEPLPAQVWEGAAAHPDEERRAKDSADAPADAADAIDAGMARDESDPGEPAAASGAESTSEVAAMAMVGASLGRPAGRRRRIPVEGRVRRMVRLLVGPRRLIPLFQVFNHRRTLPLIVDGRRQGEVVLDDTRFVGAPQRPVLKATRVEVEIAAGLEERTLPFIDALQRDCGLTPAVASKFDLGLLAAGLTPEKWTDLGPTRMLPDDHYGRAVYAVFAKQTGAFQKNEAGTRLGDDIEALHDMRVAARRLRTALRLFEDVLPPKDAKRLRRELGWVAAALGAVRDRDVQLERLAEWRAAASPRQAAALHQVERVLAADRDIARVAMLEALDSPRHEALVSSLVDFVVARREAAKAADAKKPARRMAPPRVRAAYREVRHLGDAIHPESPPESYHELRIACKRLRYALEFFRDLFGEPVGALIKPLVKLQDILGLHQDAYVAIDDLETLSAREDVQLSQAARAALRTHAREYAAHAVELRAAFPEAYAGIGEDVWREVWLGMTGSAKGSGGPRGSK